MDEVNDSENVAEQLDDISLAVPTGDEEIAEVADVESVDDSLPQLEDLNEDLEPSTTLPTPDSAIFAAARKNVDLILPSFSYFNEDFLNDFGLSELFFIDGDSLVAYALGAKELDWKHGGQYLHFIYIVEKLLNSLQERGGRFRVFFFAQNEQLWTGSKLLARQLLIFHLTKNTDVDVDIIPHHIDNVEWKNHIDFFQPAYILAKFEWEEQDEMDYKSLDIIYKALTLALHEHMLYTVILDDIDFKGNKVISFLMEPTEHIRLRAIHQKVLTFLKKHFVAPLANKSSGKKEETTIPYLEKAIEGGFDGRTSLSLVALRSLLNETATPENIALAKLYCVYLSLLQYLPLSARSHQLPPTLPATAFLNAAVPFLRKLASHMQPVLAELAQNADKSAQVKEKLSANFCDAIDGREFLAFLVAYKNEGTGSAPVDAQAEKIWSHLAASVSAIASEKFTFPEQSQNDLNASKTGLDALRSLAQRAGVQNDSLAPVDSEFVNMLVPDIKQKIASVEAKNPSSVVNPETIKNYPWHTGVDFVDNDHLLYKEEQFAAVVKGKAAQDKEEKKRLKWLQKGEATKKKFIDSFLVDSPVKRKLIAELEGPQTREERVKRARKALQPVKAEKEGPSSSKPEKGGKADKAAKKGGKDKKEEKPGKKGAQGKGSQKETGKKEKIIEEAAKKRASEGSEKGKEQLTNILQTVTKLLKQETPVTEAVELLDNFVKSRPADELALEAQLKILGYLHDEFEFAKPERKMEMVPTLFVNVQTILRKYADKDFFTGSGPKKLIKYASHFGFPDLAEAISARIESKSTEKKKEKDKESKLSKALVNIPESSIMYQLKQLGAYLARPQGKVVDDRVPFLPDDWQETLLNVVDAQESALILAPTSSGKTFISFYCMESVLRSDNDSVVVYLSPTKALVNQVEAEVLARFEKKYLPGKVLTGVFTRDFRKNEKDCQVLVTVPDCLELLLLSMDDPAWHKKIKYVIFDEIQSLGSEGGEVWEHLLLLIDAPFLALSATVNNGQQFYDWLSEVERSRNRRMHYIKYDQRYNDLKPYVYDIESKELVSLHPFYALNLRGIQHNNNELPSDLKLLPDHCVTLFESLERHLKPLGVDVSDLHPDTFFKNVQYYEWNLSMMDVVRYENALKQRFLDSIKLSPSPAQTILDDLSGSLPQVFARQTEIYNSNTPGTVLRAHLYDVLQTMKQKDMLPAIIFHFDRIRCEQLAIDLSRQLEGEERAVREKDGTLEKINSLARQIEVEKKWYVRHARDEFSKIDTKNLPESVATRVERYYDMLNHFNFLNRVDPNHSYLGREGAVTWEELCQHLRMREDDIKKVPLYMALRRGIAAHHAGLDKRYRQAVEKLFRLKKVRVVIATATLAVGINMPCKSVIFAGDSPYLNAMNYRQMSGRAGRRGFDLIGHVTFFGVPEGKIKRLTTSRLADMRGNQPLTVAFALRMMCRYNLWNPELEHVPQEEHKQAILAASKRLLERPFIALGKPVVSLNVRHQFRYAIEYLVREGYIGLDGEPRDLCGLVNHLYFLEPANFVFVSLLKMGMFDEFCKTRIKNKDHILQLLVVLSNLFCQLRLYKYQRHGRGPSIVILPALPKEFLEGIEAHNNRALTTAATYMRCFAKSFNAELGEDNTLPLSNVAFAPKSLQVAAGASGAKGGKGKQPTGKADGDDIVSVLKSTAVEYFARSSFSALSGKGDKFDSVSELVGSLRRGLFLDRTLVPTMEIEHEGLNAYIYDLYNHKSTKSLIQFNHVRRDTLYDNLKEFMVVCKTLATALTKRAPQSPVSAEFTQLSDEFSAIFSEYGHLH